MGAPAGGLSATRLAAFHDLPDHPHIAAPGAFDGVVRCWAACAVSEAPLWTSCPRAGLLAGKEARYMEDEMPFGELALVCPDGQIAHLLDWQSERRAAAEERAAPDRPNPA